MTGLLESVEHIEEKHNALWSRANYLATIMFGYRARGEYDKSDAIRDRLVRAGFTVSVDKGGVKLNLIVGKHVDDRLVELGVRP